MRQFRLLTTRNARPRPDPFALLSPQLTTLRSNLLNTLLDSGHPALSEITKYYFQHPSKQVRPVLVLLFAKATNGLGADWGAKSMRAHELDRPLTRPDVLNDWNPSLTDGLTTKFEPTPTFDLRPSKEDPSNPPYCHSHEPQQQRRLAHTILPTQLRLAQIVEMLHTASLLHDDVIDSSSLRRSHPSAPSLYGNRLSVLSGNFILGRASAALARLGDLEVTELIASVLANLVDGEILQTKNGISDVKLDDTTKDAHPNREAWSIYLQKTYLKTASLMAKAARSAVILGGCTQGEIYKEIAYAYGRNLGIAFQLVDDVLDYEHTSSTLGKPGGADLHLGLATAPALYAWEEHPEVMGKLIERKFAGLGDVELATTLVRSSSAIQKTRLLARSYADKAMGVLDGLPESEARSALEALTVRVVGREK